MEVFNAGRAALNPSDVGAGAYSYPANDTGQVVLGVSVLVNGSRRGFTISWGDQPVLVVEGPLPNVPPNGTLAVNVTIRVAVDPVARQAPLWDLVGAPSPEAALARAGAWSSIPREVANLTRSVPGFNYTSPLVSLAADYLRKSINSSTPLSAALSVARYVGSNVDYSAREPPRELWEVLATWEGDCDDQSRLYVALARALGLPSFQEFGYVHVSNAFGMNLTAASGHVTYVLVGGGGHAWAVAYIPPWGWVRIDTVFGNPSNPLSYISSAPYYALPTVVLGRSYGLTDEPTESQATYEALASTEAYLTITYEVLLEREFYKEPWP
ncbi:MAG: transglutaminase domain-containing protein [Desulfurococcaceae archaeon]